LLEGLAGGFFGLSLADPCRISALLSLFFAARQLLHVPL
jgi:hypothetical protein